MPKRRTANKGKFFRKDLAFRAETLEQIKTLKKKHIKDLKKSSNGSGTGEKGGIRDPYKNMTFLYIRANEEDNGMRPISGTVWMSPDLNVYPNTGGEEICWGIEAGQQYTIECIVHNDGDVNVPSATVDIHLANPSVGWTVSSSKLIAITNVEIPAFSSKVVTFEWTADFEDVGHRCIFARVYSMSPMDAPEDWEAFDVRNDRHIGQQNISIVKQEEEINVDVAPDKWAKGANKGKFVIIIRPAKHIPDKMRIISKLKKVNIKSGPAAAKFKMTARKKEIKKPLKMSLKQSRAVNSWFGKITDQAGMPLLLKVPNLNLRKNEGAVYEVVNLDLKTNEEIGGFTLVVLK